MIYLDNAATSFPKPPEVRAAVMEWFDDYGVDAARGSSERHEEVSLRIAACRARLAELTGVSRDHVVLTSGATEAINLFLKGSLRPGDRVWTTKLEHNAVVRPLVGLRQRLGIEVRFLEPRSAVVEPQQVLEALEEGPPPRLFVFSHASNVTGAVQDFGPATAALRDAGALILADCAQTAGRLDLRGVGADALAVPGHKGLYGPPGTGALCLRDDPGLVALREGGTGSGLDHMPAALPSSLEGGTPNTPGFFGLRAGLDWVAQRGIDVLCAHENELVRVVRERLRPAAEDGRVRLIGAEAPATHLPVLSLTIPGLDPLEIALLLEQRDVQVRAGFHCAAYVHECIGTREHGTVRLSGGAFNTQEEARLVGDLLAELAGSGATA